MPIRSGRGVLVVLGALVALGPLATDAYVPALPELTRSLGSDARAGQLSVTATLLGLGIGQLVAGPWSDAVGRRLPILVGVALFLLGAIGSAAAPTIAVLIAGRLLQGLGGAFALVAAYACVRDRFAGGAAVRAFAALLLVAGTAPVAAPLAGGALAAAGGWRLVFVALGLVGLITGVGAALGLPESRTPSERVPIRGAGSAYLALLTDQGFLRIVLVNATAFSAMFVYIAASPYVLQDGYGLSITAYSLVFAVNAAGLVTAAQASGRLAAHVPASRLLLVGVVALVGGAVLVVIAAAGLEGRLWIMLSGLFVLVASVGVILPNTAGLALEAHGTVSGAASAVLGASQYVLGAAAAAAVAGIGLPPPMAMAGLLAVLAAAAAVLVGHPRRASRRIM